ncbi:hypothetical protein O181_061709 [Austropuccinia psidii MF-1]|uniref:Uncharacterized protein n=1 Tax=Austropuccinia psidii MF-1 TaxID=1389203 RepID=A0A9Q3I0U2_9BASI|nr:hypothetical protein [Austropuccinia psidii MF-1]
MDLHFQAKNLVQDIYKAAVQAESLVDMISLGNDSQTSDQYDPDEDDYMKAASGSFSDGNLLVTAPSKTIKQRRICSNVYGYFEKTSPNGEWLEDCQMFCYMYEFNHCSVTIAIIGWNTSNINKHRAKCAGWFTAWEGKSPVLIYPNLGAKLAAEEQETLHKSLVEGIVAIQLSFSLYFKHKQKLIKEIARFPDDTYITVAIDCWTTKDQSQYYIAMVGQWIDPVRFLFCNSLLAFETLNGAHTGQALAWSVWESLSQQGLVHQLYSITGDNASNNSAMINALKCKF